MFNKVFFTTFIFGSLLIALITFFLYQQRFQLSKYQAASTTDPSIEVVVDENSEPIPDSPKPQSIKLLFGGDMMFDRNIRLKMEASGIDFVLSDLANTFAQYDTVIANLEGPVTDNPSRSVNSVVGSTDNYFFTFSPEIVPMLKKYNFQIVNLGNNHIHNFGNDGIVQTRTNLQNGGIAYFGDSGLETTSNERVLFYSVRDKTLAFVGYNQFITNGLPRALDDIAHATSSADLVIMYPHWGAEYVPTANETIQNQAHQFIDAGVDLIIGSHPHVTQQVETYKGKTIYYSLGNFVFDQYFSPETQTGLLVGVEIQPDNTMMFEEIPITMDRSGQTLLKKE